MGKEIHRKKYIILGGAFGKNFHPLSGSQKEFATAFLKQHIMSPFSRYQREDKIVTFPRSTARPQHI